MLIRSMVATLLLAAVCLIPASAQDCKDCGIRAVYLADVSTDNTIPIPNASRDSIAWYIGLLQIPKAVEQFFKNADPTGSCVQLTRAVVSDMDTSYASDPTLFSLATGLLDKAGSRSNSDPDYRIIFSVFSPDNVGYRLQAGIIPIGNVDIVKRIEVSFTKNFNPPMVGADVAQKFGPIYGAIMDYEKKRRDEGDPYAIQPKVTITPSKTRLDFNETTTIHITLTDCDGVALRNRKIKFTVTGGSLNQTTVTSDNNGTADILFTAGSTPTIAIVQGSFSYKTASEKNRNPDITPAAIQIRKPANAWYASARMFLEKSSVMSGITLDGTGVTTSNSHDQTQVDFNAWVTNSNSVVGRFTSKPLDIIQVECTGTYRGSSFWRERHEWLGQKLVSDEQTNTSKYATSIAGQKPELSLNIYENSFSFSVSKLSAGQTGGETRVWQSVDPFENKTETTFTPAESQIQLSSWVWGPNQDTTMTTTETRTLMGQRDSTIIVVWQKFSSNDNMKKLEYRRTTREFNHFESSLYKEDASSTETYNVSLYLSYNGNPPTAVNIPAQTIPATFVLNQNYPNPFNPTTMLSYVLPSATHVALTITDVLGRNVATLVDRVESAGVHALPWNADRLPSGVYFLRMRAGEFVETRKLLLAK